jgi:hypothetical protein
MLYERRANIFRSYESRKFTSLSDEELKIIAMLRVKQDFLNVFDILFERSDGDIIQ